jgi:7-cyano-7-deazaguanine synthase
MGDDACRKAGGGLVSLVNMVSGGLDSTLVGVMAREEGIAVHPLFIDYGQRAARREWESCQRVHAQLSLPAPTRMDLSGFGQVIRSGLTCGELDVKLDAFTPGRNLLFLLMGSAYAYQLGAAAVSVGLLAERFSLFPDQRSAFVEHAERAIETALGRRIRVVTPLADFSKADVVKLALEKGVAGTYSCHVGGSQPCGQCISCLEFERNEGG